MKRLFFFILTGLCLGAFSLAANEPFNLTVQNLGGQSAQLSLDFHAPDGTLAHQVTSTLGPMAVQDFGPEASAYLASGVYSVLVLADQPVVAVADQPAEGGDRFAYRGVVSPGNQAWLPLVFRNYEHYNSRLYIQNYSEGEQAGEIRLCLESGLCSTVGGLTVPSQGAAVVDLADVETPDLGDSWRGSARVITNAPMAVTVVNTNGQASYAYNGVFWGANQVYLPLVSRDYQGARTRFQVQNTSGAQASVDIGYYDEIAGATQPAAATQSLTIPAGGAVFVDAGGVAGLGDTAVYTAILSADQTIAVAVEHQARDRDYASGHTGLDGGGTLYLPGVVNQAGVVQTSMRVMNASPGLPAQATRQDFHNNGAAFMNQGLSINPLAASETTTNSAFWGGSFLGSATITGDQNLAGVAGFERAAGPRSTYNAYQGPGGRFDPAAAVWLPVVIKLADATPPAVSSISPADGAGGVDVHANVLVRFDEYINLPPSSSLGLTTAGVLIPFFHDYFNGYGALFMDPLAGALASGTTYTVWVKGGAGGVTDWAGNPMAADFTASFTTAGAPDTTAPAPLSSAPASGASGVATDTAIQVVFSEPLAGLPAGQVTLAGPDRAFVSAAVKLSQDQTAIVITPAAPLAYLSGYTLTVSGGPGGISDLAGNRLGQDFTVSFTTMPEPDTTPPTVTDTNPDDGQRGLALDTDIQITFSEAMAAPPAGSVVLAGPARASLAVSLGLSQDQKTIVVNPVGELDFDETYTVLVKGGAGGASDLAGNPLATDFTTSFTTRRRLPCFLDRINSE